MHMPLDELRKATAAAARACLPELEQISARLFDAAHALAQQANQTINDHRAAGCETRALGMSVRTQAGLWGPRPVIAQRIRADAPLVPLVARASGALWRGGTPRR